MVALFASAILFRFRLAGLAILAGFFTAAYFVNGLTLTPLTTTRKIILLALAASILGVVMDALVKRSGRLVNMGLALGTGVLAIWVFWPVLAQKNLGQALAYGASCVMFVALTVALVNALAAHPVRAGAAGLGLGLGVGATAILGASASYGVLGAALGASSGAFLLAQMAANRKTAAGVTFTLPLGILAALIGLGALLLAQLTWYVLPLLLLVPLAVWLPAPERAPVWVQAVVLSVYALAATLVAGGLAWRETPGVAL